MGNLGLVEGCSPPSTRTPNARLNVGVLQRSLTTDMDHQRTRFVCASSVHVSEGRPQPGRPSHFRKEPYAYVLRNLVRNRIPRSDHWLCIRLVSWVLGAHVIASYDDIILLPGRKPKGLLI